MSRPAPTLRSEFKSWRRFATRWSDNDVYGHVNNVVYYQWFDSAVNAWLLEQELLDIEGGEMIALVVETRCSYAAPLAFPQPVDIGLSIAELGRSSMRYRIGVFGAEDERAAAVGEFVHVLVDRASRRPVELPAAWREKLDTLRS